MAGFKAHPNGTGQGVIVSSGTYNPARRLDLPRFFDFFDFSVKVEGAGLAGQGAVEQWRQPGWAGCGGAGRLQRVTGERR